MNTFSEWAATGTAVSVAEASRTLGDDPEAYGPGAARVWLYRYSTFVSETADGRFWTTTRGDEMWGSRRVCELFLFYNYVAWEEDEEPLLIFERAAERLRAGYVLRPATGLLDWLDRARRGLDGPFLSDDDMDEAAALLAAWPKDTTNPEPKETTMTLNDIQTVFDESCRRITNLGVAGASMDMTLRQSDAYCPMSLYIYWTCPLTNTGKSETIRVPRTDADANGWDNDATMRHLLDRLETFVDAFKTPDQLRKDAFTEQLGRVIDLAREMDIDLDIANPLIEAMKRLASNALEHRR